MTDLDRLRERTWSAPPAGVLDTVTTAGRRRKRRLVTGTSVMTAAVVLLAVQLVPGSDNTQTLVPARTPVLPRQVPVTPEPDRSFPAVAGPVDVQAPVPGRSAGSDLPGGGDAAAEGQLGQVAPEPANGPAVAAPAADRATSSARPGQAPGPGPYATVQRGYVRGGAPDDCTTANSAPIVVRGEPIGRCGGASVTGTGSTRTLGVDVCVAQTAPSVVTFRFASAREVDWVVLDAEGDPVWEWGRGVSAARGAPHDVVVRPGDCLTWRTAWSGVDDDGRRLPAGDYRLTAALTGQGERYRYSATAAP